MKLDLAAVDQREEIAADEHEHDAAERRAPATATTGTMKRRAQQHRQQRRHSRRANARNRARNRRGCGRKHPWRPARRRGCSPLSSRPMVIGVSVRDRRIGREHREHHGEAERREQVFRRPVEEHHRGEHAADGERRNERRHRDPRRAMQRRIGQRLPLLGEQAMGVLDRHRGIVDQDADRERQAAERHRVERVAEEVEHDERSEDRQRDRDHHHQGRAPRAQEQQDHQRGERRRRSRLRAPRRRPPR